MLARILRLTFALITFSSCPWHIPCWAEIGILKVVELRLLEYLVQQLGFALWVELTKRTGECLSLDIEATGLSALLLTPGLKHCIQVTQLNILHLCVVMCPWLRGSQLVSRVLRIRSWTHWLITWLTVQRRFTSLLFLMSIVCCYASRNTLIL